MVVATHGEGGSCNLPDGCSPDLATVRDAEMHAAAEVLDSELVLWDLGNGPAYEPYPGDVEAALEAWAAAAGGEEALLDDITKQLEDADVVYTFDWRHGAYCHPEHRAIGALVVVAVDLLGAGGPELHLVQVNPTNPDGLAPWVPEDEALTSFDATVYLESVQDEAWRYVIEIMLAHPSQFALTEEDVEVIASLPDEMKRVWTLELSDVDVYDERYEGLCPPSTF